MLASRGFSAGGWCSVLAPVWVGAVFLSGLAPGTELALGPLLGGVTEDYAGIWGQTHAPADVTVSLLGPDGASIVRQRLRTSIEGGLSFTARFEGLKADARYAYAVGIDGQHAIDVGFVTPGPSWRTRPVRIVWGSGWHPEDRIAGRTSVFMRMLEMHPHAVIFNGDFPYTLEGRLDELRREHRVIRRVEGFCSLTAVTPTYAIYDDHDFGPNDCDGTHPHVDEALAGFKEHWPNRDYGLPGAPGCFGRFRLGDVEVFLVDSRYHRRAVKGNAQMLGARQFEWLCEGLRASTARYKLVMSSVQWGRVKLDSWNHPSFHQPERDRIFAFIAEHEIPGVVLASGDVHRCEVWKFKIGRRRYLHDFTSSALARESHAWRKRDLPKELIHSRAENGMFGELEFRPASDEETALIFRIWSVAEGLVYTYRLRPKDLNLPKP